MLSKKPKNPEFYLAVKSLLLSLVFAAVIYTIYYLNTHGLEKTALGELLAPTSNIQKQGSEVSEAWKVCRDGMYAISYFEENGKRSWKLLKKQDAWLLLYGEEKKTLSKEQMQACQKSICNLHVISTKPVDLVDFKDSLTYSFLDSSQIILRINHKKGLLMYGGKIFDAKKLIAYLREIPKTTCE